LAVRKLGKVKNTTRSVTESNFFEKTKRKRELSSSSVVKAGLWFSFSLPARREGGLLFGLRQFFQKKVR
jgi:hypothetical protein